MLHFMCSLQFDDDYKHFKKFRWLFGCPGHGKGTWDGLGGTLKTFLGRLIRTLSLIFSADKSGKHKLFEWAKQMLEARQGEDGDRKVFNVIAKWDIRWIGEVLGRPPKDLRKVNKQGKVTFDYNRIEYKAIANSFDEGTRFLFQFDMVKCTTPEVMKILVSPHGCGCQVCLQSDCSISVESIPCVEEPREVVSFIEVLPRTDAAPAIGGATEVPAGAAFVPAAAAIPLVVVPDITIVDVIVPPPPPADEVPEPPPDEDAVEFVDDEVIVQCVVGPPRQDILPEPPAVAPLMLSTSLTKRITRATTCYCTQCRGLSTLPLTKHNSRACVNGHFHMLSTCWGKSHRCTICKHT